MLIDDLYKQVFEASPFGMAIIDRNHRVLRTNAAMDRFYGRKAEPGETTAQIAPHVAETARAYIDTVFQTKMAPEPVRLRGVEGAASEWHCAFTPIAADTGQRVELCLAVICEVPALEDHGAVAAPETAPRPMSVDELAAAFADNVIAHPAALTKRGEHST
ncbi:MAG: PAS domain-containing protein [Oceanicaulis sp.]